MLQTELEEVLIQLVEAHRRVLRADRAGFMALGIIGSGGWLVYHPGLPEGTQIPPGEIRHLARVGLIDLRQTRSNEYDFDITAAGFQAFDSLQQRTADAADRVTDSVKRYIEGAAFQARHPTAYSKWLEAESLLWGPDSEARQTAIGHHCREAIQFFAASLLQQHRVSEFDPDPAKVVSRLNSVLDTLRPRLGSTELPFLKALLTYWGTVIDLIQRQEHGAQREGGSLNWHDGRRIVFQTLLVMYEIDQALSSTRH